LEECINTFLYCQCEQLVTVKKYLYPYIDTLIQHFIVVLNCKMSIMCNLATRFAISCLMAVSI